MARFGRVYSLIAGPGGGTGIEVASGGGADMSLRIAYEISKTDSKNPNRSVIRIWNLRPENRQMLEKKGTRCVLKVGYAEEGGPIEVYQGDVDFAWTQYDLPDVVTTLELAEGGGAIRDSMVSLSYKKGISSTKVVQDLARQMKLDLQMPSDVPVRTWDNGLSFHGPARSALDRVVQGTGLAWSIQNGALQVIRNGGTTNRTVFDLGADSGLLGSPERERKGAQEAAAVVTDQTTSRKKRVRSETEEVDGWRIKSLVLPSLVPGDRVKLSSRTVRGVFTIKEMRHVGDSEEGEWTTEMKVVDPAAAETDRRAKEPPGKTVARQSPAGPLRASSVPRAPGTPR